MASLSTNNWLVNIFQHIAISKEWKQCCHQIELIVQEFVESKMEHKPYLHCLLYILGSQFSQKYFPNGMR